VGAMAEGKGTHTAEQKNQPNKPPPPWWKRLWARTGFDDKTLWDLLQLLIVPLALAVIGFVFTMQQDTRQQRIENQRAQQAQKIENRRAEAERELAEQRAQDEALQAYLDQMSSLLLEKDLRDSEEDSEVHILARARTATVIQRLDADGNRNVIRFLNEASLTGNGQSSISLLTNANLQGAHLEGVNLSDINLRGADLNGANLRYSSVAFADLSGANLSDANLNNAYLFETDLSPINPVREADLSNADLSSADLGGTVLRDADLSEADLSNAYLGSADLSNAYMVGANLSNADKLDDADLSNANLWRAKMSGVQYSTHAFEPAVALKIGDGWEFGAQHETPDYGEILGIQTGPEGGQLLLTNPGLVFDPTAVFSMVDPRSMMRAYP
jgi:uncharacterized protein YjbI with pentapeptide repeats